MVEEGQDTQVITTGTSFVQIKQHLSHFLKSYELYSQDGTVTYFSNFASFYIQSYLFI